MPIQKEINRDCEVAADIGCLVNADTPGPGKMQKELLQRRYTEIYGEREGHGVCIDFANKVAAQRLRLYGEDHQGRDMQSTVNRALNNPEKSTGKILDCIVAALDGEWVFQWKVEKVVEEVRTEVFSGEGGMI